MSPRCATRRPSCGQLPRRCVSRLSTPCGRAAGGGRRAQSPANKGARTTASSSRAHGATFTGGRRRRISTACSWPSTGQTRDALTRRVIVTLVPSSHSSISTPSISRRISVSPRPRSSAPDSGFHRPKSGRRSAGVRPASSRSPRTPGDAHRRDARPRSQRPRCRRARSGDVAGSHPSNLVRTWFEPGS